LTQLRLRKRVAKPTDEEQIANYAGNLYLTEMLEACSTIWADDPAWSEGFNDEYRCPTHQRPPPPGYVDQQDKM
jgi:hypothetical protein